MTKRLIYALLFFVPVFAFADAIRIKHPGTLELIYLDPVERPPPLAPMNYVQVNYKYFYVFPSVVTPSIQSVFLLEHTVVNAGDEVLDLGTGCGVQAIFAAEKAKRVVATDLSSTAVENALYNIRGHHVESVVTARQGDLFGAVDPGDKFDVIINNIDYPYDEATQGLWKVHERFFREVKTYLKPEGRIYYQSGMIENIPKIQQMVKENGLRVMRMVMASAFQHNREPIVFLITRDPVALMMERIEKNKDKLPIPVEINR